MLVSSLGGKIEIRDYLSPVGAPEIILGGRMRIETVRVRNFRCFEDETVSFNDYTCLVGANGTGKSAILTALRVFFRDTTPSPTDLLNLQEEDCYRRETSKDVVITVTFSDLGPEAKEDFKHYVRQGKLVVSAVASWNAETRLAAILFT
jgi:putative ATP-dependent endonuclease of the OLD family